jgi:hypothetical protein
MVSVDDDKRDENSDAEKPFTREDFMRDLKRVADAKPPSGVLIKRPAESDGKKS